MWQEVDQRIRYSQAPSSSSAYADYAATRERDLADHSRVFRPVAGQVGFVACIADEVVGLEATGRPEVFAGAFQGLLRAYLIDAIDHALLQRERPVASRARFEAPEPFLAALTRAPAEARPSVGIGSDVRVDTADLRACALVAGDVVHLTAFPAETGN